MKEWRIAAMKPLVRLAAFSILGFALIGCATPDTSVPSTEAKRAMTVLVTGATGTQGGAVARLLNERGYDVRGLTRNPDSPRAAKLTALGITMVKGSFGDPATLRSAMRGADAVFAMTDFWEHGKQREVAHGRALVDSAKAEDVRHFVFSSVGGADEQTGIPHFDSKYEVEKYLAASGLHYTIFGPVSFMENWGTVDQELENSVVTSAMDPDAQRQLISVNDIAFFVAEALANPDEWSGKRLDIAGDSLSGSEMVALFSELTGRSIRYQQMSWEELEALAGEEIALMNRWIGEVGYSADIPALRARYPNLTRFRDYLIDRGWSGEPH